MNTLFTGQKIIRLEQTDSTNSYLIRLLGKEKLPEGAVVITQKQEQGRGQRGTTWDSKPNKNLTLSILLQPTFLRPDEQFLLNKAVSLGILDFICLSVSGKETEKGRKGERVRVLIKWPNDIYIGDEKIAGILIENSVSGDKLQQSILGIGINVNQEKFSSELPNPTSLRLVMGKDFDLDECLALLCSCIEKRYLELRANHLAQMDEEYLKNLYRFGERANYKYKGETLKAKITGVTTVGKLTMETEKGKMLECDFKEVEFC